MGAQKGGRIIDIETLKQFCGKEWQPSFIQTPFTQLDYTWATDGHVLKCNGTGEWAKPQPVKIGDVVFDAHLLAKIKKYTPDCLIGPTEKDEAAYLKFDGGKGFLMPTRYEEE